jgi:hypothetical protein
MRRVVPVVLAGALSAFGAVMPPAAPRLAAQTDLDAFMRTVLASRDDNWKKLQQYVLEEREQIELRGPSRTPLWGERREFTWYLRDGFFVRSPLKVNGAEISEGERRKYEAEYLRRAQERDQRGAPPPTEAPRDTDSLIRQARQPQFVSSAYFLRFKFEEGKYALVGHETLDGRDTLRIEYYPARLFTRDRRWTGRQPTADDKARAAEMERMLNKVSLVTLWVEPAAHQIVKYTFNNVAFDFLPASWFVHVDDVHASMLMGQPFPNVWLPKSVDMQASLTIAVGQFDLRYGLEYHDYRLADVTTKVTIPGAR